MSLINKGARLIEYLANNYDLGDENIPETASRNTCWKCDNIDDLVYSFKNALISISNLPREYTADYRVNQAARFLDCIFEVEKSKNTDGSLAYFKLTDRVTKEVITVVYKKHTKSKGSYHGKPTNEWVYSSASREDTKIRYIIDADARDPISRTDSHGVVVIPGYVHPFDICIPDVRYNNESNVLTVTIYTASYLEEKLRKFASTKSFQIKGSLAPAEVYNKDIPKNEWQKAITTRTDFYKHHYNFVAHEYLILDPLYNSMNVLAVHGKNMDGHEILIRQNGTWKPLDKAKDMSDNIIQEVRMAQNILSIS